MYCSLLQLITCTLCIFAGSLATDFSEYRLKNGLDKKFVTSKDYYPHWLEDEPDDNEEEYDDDDDDDDSELYPPPSKDSHSRDQYSLFPYRSASRKTKEDLEDERLISLARSRAERASTVDKTSIGMVDEIVHHIKTYGPIMMKALKWFG
ncbi:hypothetical protein D915_000964 [Fasciola hepatica]|uniref:Uncharacterized protein n=1 Tax=Fasciola hepatica TaxID=6192 RepID=A0A4E0RJ31_FASHE|nr:hypothetical protein D915_000964 [Fasciola hepatica]